MAGPSGQVIPHLRVNGAAKAIDFYVAAFGATELSRHPAPDGKRLMHAAVQLGASTIFLCDDFPEYCGGKSRTPTSLGDVPCVMHQNVPDCDAAMDRAVKAGATIIMPPADQFWGDRYGAVRDPFGYEWSFSHPLKK